jgi:NAD(P)-dependent dehydrogenase (short-subunit alcohol dehydrogenase family)
MDVLVKGVLLGIKHAAPIMKKQRSGSIINTGSVAGMQAGYGPHVYSVAKAAVIHLSRVAAMELGEWGVRVNCICPGGIVTPIFAKALGLPAGRPTKRSAPWAALRLFRRSPAGPSRRHRIGGAVPRQR